MRGKGVKACLPCQWSHLVRKSSSGNPEADLLTHMDRSGYFAIDKGEKDTERKGAGGR